MATDLQQSPTDFHLLGDQVTVMVENHIWGADLKISSETWSVIGLGSWACDSRFLAIRVTRRKDILHQWAQIQVQPGHVVYRLYTCV